MRQVLYEGNVSSVPTSGEWNSSLSSSLFNGFEWGTAEVATVLKNLSSDHCCKAPVESDTICAALKEMSKERQTKLTLALGFSYHGSWI